VTDQTSAFIPPAAEGLPPGALDSAAEGAGRLDAMAATRYGRNLLAHALVQQARDGWLRREAADGFEPERAPREDPKPEDPASAVLAECDAIEADYDGQRDDVAVGARAAVMRIRTKAVLPASVDRATVLNEAADYLAAQCKIHSATGPNVNRRSPLRVQGMTDAEELLRRLAVEARDGQTTQARRGDQFEAWLKAQRDEHPRPSHAWVMVDCVLDTYRLYADTGTPLSEHVCEGQAIGDCEHLEPTATGPAGGAQQPTEAERVVAFRSRGGRLLRCLTHTPGAVAVAHGEFDAVTSGDLPDGGICTYPECGVDVLIPQQPKEA